MQWEDRIGRRLKLRDLHTLQIVSEARSMAKASQRLGLSQPAISKAIMEMEQALGTRLLDRSSVGVELTASGQMLVDRTRLIFDEVRQGVKDIEHLNDPTKGEVRIGVTEPNASRLAQAIAHLSRRYPGINYAVEVTDTTTMMRLLRERSIDVALTRWTARNAADDLRAEPLFKTQLAVMAAKQHPLMRARKLVLKDLMTERWTLSPPDSFLGQIVRETFSRSNLDLPVATVISISIYMRLTLLADGGFLSVLPRSMLQHPGDKTWLRALPVELRDPIANISAITLVKRRPAGAVKLFLEACRAAAAGER
jgi:DNA-binding transcriptional LysR family regulator